MDAMNPAAEFSAESMGRRAYSPREVALVLK
jgi:hypothetical protein